MGKSQIKIGNEGLILETGNMAKQADGAVTIQYGGTVVLVTVVGSKEPKEEFDFFPLTVEYQERTYAAGKIPGGFFKREGRPSEKEILTARLIDRPIRPLFPHGFLNEIQIMAMVLSSDGKNDPDILSLNAASAALCISDIPFNGPIGAVRVGRVDDVFIINPTYEQLEKSDLDLVVAGNKTGIIMVEAGTNQVSEETILEAIEFGHKNLQDIIKLQEEFAQKFGRPKITPKLKTIDPEVLSEVKKYSASRLQEINQLSKKEQREESINVLASELVEKFVTEDSVYTEADIKLALVDVEKEEVRRLVLHKKERVDGRDFKGIRPISCQVGILPRTHGSGLFTRGQTQSLSVTTLGTSADEQMIDALEGEEFKNFMLHYNFPPFSVGEIKPVRGPGRREIGHGALAERALKPIMPSKDDFPYTVRVVSDILESNGSSSMATVCAGTLSLMDAGVPIKAPVSGIAIGLVKEKDKFAILTDIAGVEDHYGDMDFKITGTAQGITAVQLDLKIDGVNLEIIKKSLEQAKEARLIILDKMAQAIAKPKEEISLYAPRIVTLKINPEKIKDLIGPGGKIIKKIIEETKVTIDIEDDGKVMVASVDEENMKKAIEKIKSLTEEPEIGKIYLGKIKRIMNFGAFCEFLPGQEGLIHVSELAHKFVKNVEDEVKIGDEVMVKVIEIDEQGRVNLSRKQAIKNE
jgi:polyribonucleotide nucleotidyltransferase